MKNALIALSLLAPLAAGCTTADDVAVATDSLSATDVGFQHHVYRGSVDAGGRRLSVEVDVATTRNVSQMRYCDRYDSGELYAGASISAGWSEKAGTITTRVRDAAGYVVGEESTTFFGLSAYDNDAIDPKVACSKDAKIIDRSPVAELSLLVVHGWIPGVVAKVPGGDVWVNPSYGGVGTEFISFQGVARFSTEETGTFGPRPFDSVGQELKFARGKLTLDVQPELALEVGWDVDAFHAKERTSITLKK